MKLKLVKLEEGYKEQLADMLEEWYATGEKIVPYALCKENPLYYSYCPPFVTPDSIRADMAALLCKRKSAERTLLAENRV